MKQQHKTKSLPQQATYWLGVIAVGLTVGLGIQFAQAWTNPPAGAPDGNVAGPITTGGDQTKAGRLGLQGQSASSGYPNGWSGGLHAWDVFAEGTVGAGKTAAGGVRSYFNGGWAQFPGFSDADNGNYYADPAGWSVYSNFQTRDNDSWGYIALGEGGVYNSNPGSHVGSLHVNDIYIRAINRWASQLYGLGNLSGGGGVNYFRGNTNVDLGWHKLCYINYLHIQEDDFICNLYVDGYDNGRYHWRMGFYSEKNMSCQTYCLD